MFFRGQRGEPSLGWRWRRLCQPRLWAPFPIRLRHARARAWLVRHGLFRRVIAIACVLVVGLVLFAVVSRARAVEARWGTTIDVVVVNDDVALDADLATVHFTISALPQALVPEDALRSVPAPDDSMLRPLRAGDIVTERDLRSMRTGLVMPVGHRALSVPLDPTIPHLVVGDLVDLYLVMPSVFGVESSASVAVEDPALVVDVTGDAVVLAVPSQHVGAVAQTAADGALLLALR